MTAAHIIETTVGAAGDVNPASNPSSVSFGYSASTATMTLTHSIGGLPASGTPTDIVFDGTAHCGGLDSIPLTITIPKGATDHSRLGSDTVLIGGPCTLEVTRPQVPFGYRWWRGTQSCSGLPT